MATLKDIQAKKQELITSGVDPKEATRQAFTESRANTSAISPTAPIVSPTQGSFNEQTQGMNVGERRDIRSGIPTTTPTPISPVSTQVTGVDGKKFTQAPVDPTTGLSKPIESTTKVTPTTAPEVDKTAEIKAQTEAKLVENQQKAQLEETKRQAIAKETAQANVPTSQQDILNTLVSGAGVQPQKTQAYRAAQFMYNKYNKYNAMTPSQLEMSLKNGEISTDLDRLLSSNPNYVEAKRKHEEYTKVETLNNAMGTLSDSMSGKTPEPVDEMQALSDKIIKSLNIPDQTYADAYTKYVANNPQVVQYTEQLSGINRDIASMTQKINDGYKQLASEKGDMPAASYLLYAQNQMSEATDYLNALNNTKTYLQADLTNAMEMGKAQFDAVSKDISNALSQKNSVISQLIQQQFSLAGKEAEADLAAKIEKEAMNDPAKAIANVMATYAEMGIPFTQSIQTKVADAEDFIAQGGTLSGYLDKMIKDIQAKPEYQRAQQIQMGQLSDAEKLSMQYKQQTAMQDRTFSQQLAMNDINFNQDIKKLAIQYDMNDAKSRIDFKRDLISNGMSETQADAIVRNETGAWNGVTGEKLVYAEDGTFIKSTLKNTTNPNGGIECAEYISKMIGSRVGSTWEEKKKLNDETTGTIGSIAVWQPVKTGDLAKYGHAGIIVGEDGDNWIIKSANYNVDGRISTDTIPKSEIEGYRTTKLNTTLGAGQNKEASSLAQNIMDGIGSLTDLTPTARKEVLPELDRIIKAKSTDDKNRNMILKSAISTKEVDATSLQKLKDMETVKFQMSTIAKNLASQDTGPIIGKIREFNPYDTEAQVALAQLAGLTPKVARGIFGEVGVLTDADLANYQKALPNLKSTEEKNKLVVDFMTKLLAEGYKNSLVQEAKAGRNVANYIDDYDALVGQTGTAPKPTMTLTDLKTELLNIFKK